MSVSIFKNLSFFVILCVSCTSYDYVDVECHWSEKPEASCINFSSNNSDAHIQKVSDFWSSFHHENQVYALIPNRFQQVEDGGAICLVGEPERFFFMDSTQREWLRLEYETDLSDQMQYETAFPEQKYLNRFGEKNELREETPSTLRKQNLKSWSFMPFSRCNIDGNMFYGRGIEGVTNDGKVYEHYIIYGYRGNVLYMIKDKSWAEKSRLDIEELFCIAESFFIQIVSG